MTDSPVEAAKITLGPYDGHGHRGSTPADDAARNPYLGPGVPYTGWVRFDRLRVAKPTIADFPRRDPAPQDTDTDTGTDTGTDTDDTTTDSDSSQCPRSPSIGSARADSWSRIE